MHVWRSSSHATHSNELESAPLEPVVVAANRRTASLLLLATTVHRYAYPTDEDLKPEKRADADLSTDEDEKDKNHGSTRHLEMA
ncbi:hypothetical protein JCM8097_001990 [Rhodosporidiobolus ruineniae]